MNINKNFTFRKIDCDDYRRGFYLLFESKNLENPSDIDYYKFKNFVDSLDDNKNIFVCTHNDRIIASILCICELKIYNNFSKIGYIKDFLIYDEFNNENIFKNLLNLAINFLKNSKCKKIFIDNNCIKCEHHDLEIKNNCIFKEISF